MGIVVEAEDCQLKRRVALKVMRASLVSDLHRRRFLREAQAAAAIENAVPEHRVATVACDDLLTLLHLERHPIGLA